MELMDRQNVPSTVWNFVLFALCNQKQAANKMIELDKYYLLEWYRKVRVHLRLSEVKFWKKSFLKDVHIDLKRFYGLMESLGCVTYLTSCYNSIGSGRD